MGNRGETTSIGTQRQMLTQYAKEHGLRVVSEYCDDGWSGTTFERPGWASFFCVLMNNCMKSKTSTLKAHTAG